MWHFLPISARSLVMFPGVTCPQRKCSFYRTCTAAKTNGKLRLEKQRGPASRSQPRVNGDQEKSSQHFFFLQMILRIKKNLAFIELSWCFLSERHWDDMLAASMNSSDKQLEQRKVFSHCMVPYGGKCRWDQKTISPRHTGYVLTTCLVMRASTRLSWTTGCPFSLSMFKK